MRNPEPEICRRAMAQRLPSTEVRAHAARREMATHAPMAGSFTPVEGDHTAAAYQPTRSSRMDRDTCGPPGTAFNTDTPAKSRPR